MSVSAYSVIHFTKKLKTLLQIIKTNGFLMKYCKEEFFFSNGDAILYAFPMACFCDLPLSEAHKHMGLYGYYGIGLTKEWAKSRGLNPVLYLEKDAILTKTIKEQIHRIHLLQKKSPPTLKEKKDDVELQELLTINSHMKNYEGDVCRNGKINTNYRFYDEREWRYVPSKEKLNKNPRAILIKEYEKDKEKHNKKVRKIKLDFEISDISYIIVKKEKDIITMLNFINKKFKNLSLFDREILMTKLLVANQINNDF